VQIQIQQLYEEVADSDKEIEKDNTSPKSGDLQDRQHKADKM
jgi:hypothetical protein